MYIKKIHKQMHDNFKLCKIKTYNISEKRIESRMIKLSLE